MLLYLRVACPYFYPRMRMAHVPASMPRPLGDLWEGECHTPGATPEKAPKEQVEPCNMGYPAGRCRRFPQAGPDAVRFSIAAETPEMVRVRWCVESDHLPHAAGELDFPKGADGCAPGSDQLLSAQAAAYVASYLRRRGTPVKLHAAQIGQ